MNGQEDHPHVPQGLFTPHRPIPTLPENTDQFIDGLLASPPQLQQNHHRMETGGELNATAATASHQQSTMEFTPERFQQLQALAERQAKQIEEGNIFQNQAAAQLQESQRQLEATQKSLTAVSYTHLTLPTILLV